MKTQIKNQIKNSGKTRSQRRGTFKNPNIYEMGRNNGNYLPLTPFVKGGFRVNHPSIKLLKEWDEVDKDPSKNEGEWLMETFNNMNQVISFPPSYRKLVKDLLNMNELHEYLELDKIDDPTGCGFSHQHENRNENPERLLTFYNILDQRLEDEMKINGDVTPLPKCLRTSTTTTNLNHNTKCYFLRVYKNKIDFQSDVIDFELSSVRDGVEVGLIKVKDRFNGTGTRFLEILKGVSEDTNIPLYLFPIDYDSVFEGGTKGLQKWYERKGFIQVGELPVHTYQPNKETSTIPTFPISEGFLEEIHFSKDGFFSEKEVLKELKTNKVLGEYYVKENLERINKKHQSELELVG